MKWKYVVASLILIVSLSVQKTLRAQVKLPAIISDNMVLQSDMKTPIWGWAQPGEKVEIKFQAEQYTTLTDQTGKWSITLDKHTPGGPFKMFIMGNESRDTIDNILVGEVWLASGQSNMEFGLQNETNGKNAIAQASDNQIRLFYVPMSSSLARQNDIQKPRLPLDGKWIICSQQTLEQDWAWHGFSAIGYYFAQQLRKSTGRPVGIIGSYKGGTEAQPWISAEDFLNVPELKKYTMKDGVATPPNLPDGKYKDPSSLFNPMIAPLIPYGIKGVIWYQGESNGDNIKESVEYNEVFPALIRNWRREWNQGDFPFLFVQLPNFRKPPQLPSEGNWAWVREAQQHTLSLPNTGMAVAIDAGDPDDIHPKNKQAPAMRLALIARHDVYGEDIEIFGPVYRSLKIKKNKIYLSFDHAKGLTGNDNINVRGFAIAGDNGNFVWADAIIKGSKIIVSSKEISKPVAVRYNWADNPAGKLSNSAGLPASPFRTDDWKAFK